MKTALMTLLALALVACSGGGLTQDDVDQAVAEALAAEEVETEEVETEEEPEPEPVPEPDPEPEPEPEAEPGTYGSDPVMDRLQDRCADGDMDACDDLFWDSPLGSEYEAFAQDMRYGTSSSSNDLGLADEDMDFITELALELAWDDTSPADRAGFCEGYHLLGPEFSYEFFADGWGSDAPSLETFKNFYDGKC